MFPQLSNKLERRANDTNIITPHSVIFQIVKEITLYLIPHTRLARPTFTKFAPISSWFAAGSQPIFNTETHNKCFEASTQNTPSCSNSIVHSCWTITPPKTCCWVEPCGPWTILKGIAMEYV